MKIDQQCHRLGDSRVTHLESPNRGEAFAPGQPDTIVIHYTAGASAESAVRTLCDSERKVSAHLVVGRNGSISQLLPFDTIGWHAGRSSWAGRTGLNRYAIGIEVDNAGRLTKTEGGTCLSWFGRRYESGETIRATHRNETNESWWHRFSADQLAVVEELCSTLIDTYGIDTIVGHEEIAPDRKDDPGPAFPLDALRRSLLSSGSRVAETTGVVAAKRLNIRSGPSVSEAPVAGHLKAGTAVRIVERRERWLKVEVALSGWVVGRYVEEG